MNQTRGQTSTSHNGQKASSHVQPSSFTFGSLTRLPRGPVPQPCGKEPDSLLATIGYHMSD